MSAYRLITVLETLAIQIRSDTNIKGITIDNMELKIRLLADDITMLLNDLNSVKSSHVVPKMLHQYSALKSI